MKLPQPEPDQTIFSLDPGYRLLSLLAAAGVMLAGTGAIAALAASILAQPDATPVGVACVSLVFLSLFSLITARIVAFARHTRLVLTDAGLTYHTPGLTMTALWPHIRAIDSQGQMDFAQPPQVKMRDWYWLTMSRPWAAPRIPLWLFAYGPGSALQRAMIGYAAHLR